MWRAGLCASWPTWGWDSHGPLPLLAAARQLWGLGRDRRCRRLHVVVALGRVLAPDDCEIQPDLHLLGLAVDRHFGLAVDVPAQTTGAEFLHNGGVRYAVDDDGQSNGVVAELGARN